MTAELPAWLSALVDQRMALVNEAVAPAAIFKNQAQLIVTPLAEPPEGASDREFQRWDRTCDCCRKYCSYPTNFYTGHIQRQADNGVAVIMTFGVCEEHRV